MKALPLSVLIAMATGVAQPNSDVLFSAMTDELSRSVEKLKIQKYDKPYYVSYLIADNASLELSASFGACTTDRQSHWRNLCVDVHVGDYNLDNGNMRTFSWSDSMESSKLSLDDNYRAVRQKLWLATDHAYKRAVENLERKRAILQQKNDKERPDDWSKEHALVLVQPKQEFSPDRITWRTRIKNLSSIFKDFPRIRQSGVDFRERLISQYFVNSEGSKSRVTEQNCLLNVTCTAQASDGRQISDSLQVAAADEQHMPPKEQLEAKIKELANRISRTLEAQKCESYQGPVMFEGQAAADFFNNTLPRNVVAIRPTDEEFFGEGGRSNRIGRRILPTFINVEDDPLLKDESGTRLPGGSDVDVQGVRVQPVMLVEKGILKTLLSTRLPTLEVKSSNGHALDWRGRPRISNLIIQSDTTLSPEELKRKLIEYGKEDGLEYVLIVRKLGWGHGNGGMAFEVYDEPGDFEGGYRFINNVQLPEAVECTRLYISDGHEEPVRDAEFATTSLRILRDIVATGNDSQNYQEHAGTTYIRTPSIIVKEVEIQKSRRAIEKPPTLSTHISTSRPLGNAEHSRLGKSDHQP